MGKGDTPRKVDKQRYDKNYERIFRKTADGLLGEVSDVLPGVQTMPEVSVRERDK